jgi:hypothetical protein
MDRGHWTTARAVDMSRSPRFETVRTQNWGRLGVLLRAHRDAAE